MNLIPRVLPYTVLVLLLSLLAVHMTSATVYECSSPKLSNDYVNDESAQLTKGCTLDYGTIRFELERMYIHKNGGDPVVINISQASFLNQHIMLIKAHLVLKLFTNPKPLLFTMRDSEMSGTSMLEFGSSTERESFKLPPNSRISILDNKMTITAKKSYYSVFIFNTFQLVTDSSMEIAHNVISMEYKEGDIMSIFYVRGAKMTMISESSSFTLRDNKIDMSACCVNDKLTITQQYVWYQDKSILQITKNSNYRWTSNNISMVINGGKGNQISQYVWYIDGASKRISANSQLLLDSNRILMLALNYAGSLRSSVLMSPHSIKTGISLGSSVIWRNNCVGMGQKANDKRNVFIGKWNIASGGELQFDGNYFTTTEKCEQDSSDSWQAQFLWGPEDIRDVTIATDSNLSIANTQIHCNKGANSVVWNSPLSVLDKTGKQPPMDWSSYPAQDSSGSAIATLDSGNIEQYMCVGLPTIPTTPVVKDPSPPPAPPVPPVTDEQTIVMPAPIIPDAPTANEKPDKEALPTTPEPKAPVVSEPTTTVPTTVITDPIPAKPVKETTEEKHNGPPKTATDTKPTAASPDTTGTTPIPSVPSVTKDTTPTTVGPSAPTTVGPSAPSVPTTKEKPDNGVLPTTPEPKVPVLKKPTVPTTVVGPKPNTSLPVLPKYNKTSTANTTVESAAGMSSTIPAVLITSVVFLYLYNW